MLPRDVVYLDPGRTAHRHTVRYRWDGSLKVAPGAKEEGAGEFVLVLDPELPFRRRFRMPGAGRFARHAVADLAAELFPFPREEARYALGETGHARYVLALPEEQLRELTDGFPRPPRAVLVGDGEPEALAGALSRWATHGRSYDLLGRARPLPRSLVLTVLLAAALVAASGWGVADLVQRYGAQREAEAARVAQMRREAEVLAKRRVAIAHMNAAYEALSDLVATGGGRVQALLGALIEALPEDVELRGLTFDGEGLRVSGWSAGDLDWIEGLAGEVRILEHEELPERDRFEIEIRLDEAGTDARGA